MCPAKFFSKAFWERNLVQMNHTMTSIKARRGERHKMSKWCHLTKVGKVALCEGFSKKGICNYITRKETWRKERIGLITQSTVSISFFCEHLRSPSFDVNSPLRYLVDTWQFASGMSLLLPLSLSPFSVRKRYPRRLWRVLAEPSSWGRKMLISFYKREFLQSSLYFENQKGFQGSFVGFGR